MMAEAIARRLRRAGFSPEAFICYPESGKSVWFTAKQSFAGERFYSPTLDGLFAIACERTREAADRRGLVGKKATA